MPPRKRTITVIDTKADRQQEFRPVTPKMRDSGFIRLRDGIWEHLAHSRMTPHDFAVYVTLHKWANWRTGICLTTAASIASNWGEWGSTNEEEDESDERKNQRKKRTAQNCLLRLRGRGYINYREGDGKRGVYPILINKYEPPLGALVGWSLIAESTNFENPIYEYVSPTSFAQAYGEKFARLYIDSAQSPVQSGVQAVSALEYGQRAVDRTPHCRVRVPFQDVLKMVQEVQQVQDGKSNKASTVSGSASLNDLITDSSTGEDYRKPCGCWASICRCGEVCPKCGKTTDGFLCDCIASAVNGATFNIEGDDELA